jgi:hypothetical protein
MKHSKNEQQKLLIGLSCSNLHKSIFVVPTVKPANVISSLGQRLLYGGITEPDFKDMSKVTIISIHDWGSNQKLFSYRVVDWWGIKVYPS